MKDDPVLSQLGGSWVAISGVISLLIWAISIVTLLVSLLITTHEPPTGGEEVGQSSTFGKHCRNLNPKLVALPDLHSCLPKYNGHHATRPTKMKVLQTKSNSHML